MTSFCLKTLSFLNITHYARDGIDAVVYRFLLSRTIIGQRFNLIQYVEVEIIVHHLPHFELCL